jgi:CheY-like chemotaxis protein
MGQPRANSLSDLKEGRDKGMGLAARIAASPHYQRPNNHHEPSWAGHQHYHQPAHLGTSGGPVSEYTIILADDHVLMRDGIRNIIEAVGGLKVVGEASDGHQLLKMMKKTIPDMVILDISMPGMRGIEAAREIKHHCPEGWCQRLSAQGGHRRGIAARNRPASHRPHVSIDDSGQLPFHGYHRHL